MTTICALTVPSVVRPATAKRDVRARAFGGKKAGGVAVLAAPPGRGLFINVRVRGRRVVFLRRRRRLLLN